MEEVKVTNERLLTGMGGDGMVLSIPQRKGL